jgi:hypothetical protein
MYQRVPIFGLHTGATASEWRFRLDKTQWAMTGSNDFPTASGGLRWGQGGLNFPDSMRLGETRWDSCRATETFCHSGYCLEESGRGDSVREPAWRC